MGCWLKYRELAWEEGKDHEYEFTSVDVGDSNRNSINQWILACQPKTDMAKQASQLCYKLSWACSVDTNIPSAFQAQSSFINTVAVMPDEKLKELLSNQ